MVLTFEHGFRLMVCAVGAGQCMVSDCFGKIQPGEKRESLVCGVMILLVMGFSVELGCTYWL